MTVAEAIRDAAQRLSAKSDTARLDAELLMAHALGMSRSDMLIRCMDEPVPGGFEKLIKRRATHEPVAHITGVQEFYGLELKVTPDVLIPRGDSETLIEAALELCPNAMRVIDLGTGSGALLIATLLEIEGSTGTGIDASSAALTIAQANAEALGLGPDRARLLRGDWREKGWANDLGTFDLILCNPPYVEEEAALDPDVRDYEPPSALFAGKDGLDDYRELFPQLRKLMNRDAVAIFEIGHTQGQAVTELAQKQGFQTKIRRDLANRDRAVVVW